jgi:glutamate-5-semialdehyde dehydrogenase
MEATTVREAAQRARTAARELRGVTRERKDLALRGMADALVGATASIIEANNLDVSVAESNGTSPALIDRLTLTEERIADIASALRELADLPDPVGEVVRGSTLPNGLQLRQIRVPFGVVAMIYEARPNVTVDAAGLSLKSGNAALLRGSSSAAETNAVLISVMQGVLAEHQLPVDAIQGVPGRSHDSVTELLTARGLIDVVIPRGGADLIANVVTNATVPVIETGVGNCHVYVDANADVDKAVTIALNSKAQRVSVCNAAETLLVHREIAPAFMPAMVEAFRDAKVLIHGDERVREYVDEAMFAQVNDEDWAAEYYSLDIAVGIVDTIDDAIAHIRRWSSGHTEAIVSDSQTAINTFINGIDSAAVMVNASTRFTDGGEFGFGAEIGISTQKMHARGPMGLTELTTTTFIVTGDGHIRE